MLLEKQDRQANPLMTVKEVATYLAVTERTIYRLVKENRLPAYKVGGQWRFKAEMLDAWMNRERTLAYADGRPSH